VSLPTADDLFRRTADEPADSGRGLRPVADESVEPAEPGQRRTSGRVRHDEKMTVYVTSDELLDLEHARLSLRREHGLAIDRGRLVREAITMALADLEENGVSSALVRRLRGETDESPVD
jgi:hypothetical protein